MTTGCIYVVSGLPRSGTSMMMQMLGAAGLLLYCDEQRPADDSNPRGYFEVERVKNLAKDATWLKECVGKAIKIVSPLLSFLPPSQQYKVIFMHRPLEEVLASQQAMMKRRNTIDFVADVDMMRYFSKHLADVEQLFQSRPEMDVLLVAYHDCLWHPAEQAQKIARFLNVPMNSAAMLQAIDPELRHQGR